MEAQYAAPDDAALDAEMKAWRRLRRAAQMRRFGRSGA